MYSYTADQLVLLTSNSIAKMAVEIGDSYFFCTGENPIEITTDGGDEWFEPKGMTFDDVEHGEFGQRFRIKLEDSDAALAGANYTTRFSGTDVITRFYLKDKQGEDWELILTLDWTCRHCQWGPGFFTMNLYGNTGFRPRAGLSVASRYCDLKFKGTLCGYASSLKTCPGTYDACTTRGQTTQFRGFRYAPNPGQVLVSGDVVTVFNRPDEPDEGAVGYSYPPWYIAPLRRPHVRRTSGRRGPRRGA